MFYHLREAWGNRDHLIFLVKCWSTFLTLGWHFKWNHFHLPEDRLVPQKQQILLAGSLRRERAAWAFQSAEAEQGQGSALLNAHKFSNTGIVFKTELKLQLAHFLKCKGLHSGIKHTPRQWEFCPTYCYCKLKQILSGHKDLCLMYLNLSLK